MKSGALDLLQTNREVGYLPIIQGAGGVGAGFKIEKKVLEAGTIKKELV